MWPELPIPVVFAHRGDKVHAPENTLAAFELAARQGVEAIEFDVKLTADRQVVIIHDASVNRTTNGRGKISRMTLQALRELDAGSFFSVQFQGERIPTLDEVFEAVGNRVYMNIELTNYSTPFDDLVSRVVGIVQKHGMEKRVLFSSFFPHNLARARALVPGVPRGLLASSGGLGLWARSLGWRGDYAAFHPYWTDVNDGLIYRVHAAGKRIHVWTVNAEADLRRLIGLGVDGIFTDDPMLARRLLGRAV